MNYISIITCVFDMLNMLYHMYGEPYTFPRQWFGHLSYIIRQKKWQLWSNYDADNEDDGDKEEDDDCCDDDDDDIGPCALFQAPQSNSLVLVATPELHLRCLNSKYKNSNNKTWL